jgi:hypothetical protein
MADTGIRIKIGGGGIGFLGLLTLLFAVAKLFGFVAWSWIWVFSPLWIVPAALVGAALAVVIVVGVVLGIVTTMERIEHRSEVAKRGGGS